MLHAYVVIKLHEYRWKSATYWVFALMDAIRYKNAPQIKIIIN